MLQQHFPTYFTELYLKLPYNLITYWNDEDDCHMAEVGVDGMILLRTHADTFEDVSRQVRDLLVVDMESTIIHENEWPLSFFNSGKLFTHLQEVMEEMGYQKLIDFIEYEKHIIRSAFYDHLHQYQNGLIHQLGTYKKEDVE